MEGEENNTDTGICVHVYALCWNEAVILPHFLKHYAFAEKIVILDNGSDDGSQALVEAASNGEVRSYNTDGELSDKRYLQIKNSVWKESRGEADFVIVCDADEFLYHPDLPGVLNEMKRRGASILMPKGYEMVGQQTPRPEDDLLAMMREGVRLHTYDKCLLFDPEAIEETDFEMGCHVGHPLGRVQYFRVPGLMLLHYKHLSPEYVWDRYELYRKRMSDESIRAGIAPHYQITRERFDHRYEKLRREKTDVIALAGKSAEGGIWQQQADDLKGMLEGAIAALTKRDFDQAYRLIERFADWRCERFFVHTGLAVIFAHRELDPAYDAAVQKSMNAAESSFSVQRALMLAGEGSSRIDALLQIARAFNQAGYFDLGLPCLENANQLAPERADVLMRLAYVNQKKGHFDKALKYCARVIQKQPKNFSAYQLSGKLLGQLGRSAEAERMFAVAQSLQGEVPRA